MEPFRLRLPLATAEMYFARNFVPLWRILSWRAVSATPRIDSHRPLEFTRRNSMRFLLELLIIEAGLRVWFEVFTLDVTVGRLQK